MGGERTHGDYAPTVVRRPGAIGARTRPAAGPLRGPPALLDVQRQAANRASAHYVARRRSQPRPSGSSRRIADVVRRLADPGGPAGGPLDAAAERAIDRQRGTGARLDGRVRAQMEGAFGSDFGDVRVHTGRSSDDVAGRVQASAFTVGNDVFVSDRAPGLNTAGGQELLAHELVHVVQQTGQVSQFPIGRVGEGVGRRIQRKGAHFWSYVTKHTVGLDPANNVTHKEMLIVGWVLDQNVYDLSALLSGDQKDIDWQNTALLATKGLGVADVGAFLQAKGAKPGEPADTQMAFLTQFIAQLPAQLTSLVSAEAAKGGKAASKIRWLGLLPWGAGTGVHLQMLPGGLPKGSQPDSEPVWMKTVEQHHPSTNNTTLYVRGHLLNHNIGGPGLDYNMVPITGKPAKNVGANDANAEHLHAVETKAKDTWDLVEAGKLMEANYGVEPKYNRTPRAETGQVRAAERAMRTVLENAKTVVVARLQKLSVVQLQQEWLAKSGGHGITGFVPSPQQMIDMLAQAEVSEAERNTVASLRAAKNAVMAAVDLAVPADLLDASANGDASVVSLRELYGMVNGNAATWEAEEVFIPTVITVALETTDLTGTTSLQGPLDVPVTLSTDVAKVHYRPKKKSEEA